MIYSKVKLVAATYIMSKNNIYENLPRWVQEVFDEYQIVAMPQDTTSIVVKLEPLETFVSEEPSKRCNLSVELIARPPGPRKWPDPPIIGRREIYPYREDLDIILRKLKEIFGQDYNTKNFPYIVPADLIPLMVEKGLHIVKFTNTDGGIYYISCINYFLRIKPGTNNHPICDRTPQDLTGTPYEILDIERLRNLVGKKAMKTNGNFVVYIDNNFRGNYIYSTNYEIIPELNAIVIL